jgi:hypothetical protein
VSSYNDTPDSDTKSKQLIQDRQERLEGVLDIFSQRAAEVQLTPEMKREIAVHVVNYHRVLSQYEGESVLSEGDIPDISPIRERLGRTTRVLSESNRRSGGATYEEVPAVDELDFWALEEIAVQLEAAAKKLGFWASAEATRPLYDAGKREQYPNPVDDDIPKPEMGGGGGDGPLDLRYSKLYHDWYQRVACGDPNDYVIAISADPRSTGVSGSGKTTFGGGLAKRWLDYSESGFDAEVQYTLDPSTLAYDLYEDTGELAVLLGDEMQGTPATTGLNSKRSQKTEALDTINAIAAGRSDRKTVILIVQDLKSLNKDALTFIDAWLLIRDDYDYVATHYSVAPDVFDLGSRDTKTPGVEQITWDALPEDDDDYQVMEEKKEAAKRGEREYSDDEGDSTPTMPKEERDRMIQTMDDGGMDREEIAETFGLTPGRISQIVNSDS